MPDTRPSEHRRTASAEALAAAFHESGHAVAIVRAFRNAAWLPNPMPPLLVRSVEIAESTPAQWVGNCVGTNIYSAEWDISCIAPRFRPLMEAQAVIHLSGGVAEAIFRGERRAREALAFAVNHCSMDTDLERAAAVLGDLRRLTGYRLDAQYFAERTLALVLDNWCAVEALASSALIVNRRIEGARVEAIIDRSTSAS